jgi:peptidoglycan hydrolase-like protein with peptidoglycan-binding domain
MGVRFVVIGVALGVVLSVATGVVMSGSASAQDSNFAKPVPATVAAAPAAPAKKHKAAKPNPAKPNPANPPKTAKPADAPRDGASAAITPSSDDATPQQTATVNRRKGAAEKKKPARTPAVQEAYAAMPETERLAIQSDLAWVGDYQGMVDGDFNDQSIAAVKAFQKRRKEKETGILTPEERTALAAAAKPHQDAVGWRLTDDFATDARLGLPGKLAPSASTVQNGSRWSSAQGQIQIETFRLREAALPALFEQLKKTPSQRQVSYSVLKPDFFVISGVQVLKKFYVRAQAKGIEIRGVTILYDQATEGTMDPVVVAMSNAFQGFPGPNAGPLPGQRRRVEYGTAIVVSAAGDLIADRQLTAECQSLVVPGLGHADRIAEDKASDLALLRVYGARNLVPAAFPGEAAAATDLKLVGIADPQAQAGGGAVSRPAASLTGGASIEPVPPLGFSGAVAIDAQNRVVGMVELKAPVIASTGAASPQAVLVPAAAIRTFLLASKIVPATTGAGIERSVLRVICVRK